MKLRAALISGIAITLVAIGHYAHADTVQLANGDILRGKVVSLNDKQLLFHSDSFGDINGETAELIRFLGLEGIEDIQAGDLSYGGQRLVDLGIALGSKPHVLLLDEPLAGLAAAERERVSNLIKNIAVRIPVLIVEHDIDRVLGFSRRVTVMNQGEVLMTGSPEEVRNDRRVQEVYTGTGQPPATERAATGAGENCVLRFEKVNAFYGKSHILNDATLDVRDREIVALLGRNGAGKSTLLKTLCGLVPAASGTIDFDGRNITGLPTPEIARMASAMCRKDADFSPA